MSQERPSLSPQSQAIGGYYRRVSEIARAGDVRRASVIASHDELLRQSYEEIFDSQRSEHTDEPEWWKREFEDAATLLIEHTDIPQSVRVENHITLSFDDRLYEFDNRTVLTVGRYPGCDVKLPDINNACSRLHCLVFLFPERREYIVADIGSLKGLITESRSSDKECQTSFPRARNIFIFDWDEFAVIKMGDMKVVFNPKECMVCRDAPRQTVLECGHNVVCLRCMTMLTVCPECRAPLDPTKTRPMLARQTYVGNL